ncbi:MAG TPA: ribosome small subunit-dependent GTPase A [Chloroflexota bacterium]|nr:ribosome small subunit-dependent GTPase A [Chloroflexota bacterium]
MSPKHAPAPAEPMAGKDGAGSPDAPASPLLEGMVSEGSRGHYLVETAQGVLRCVLRGRLRKHLLRATVSPALSRKVRRANVMARDPLAAGDRVRVLVTGEGQGVIEEILPRQGGSFTREDPGVASRSGVGKVTTVAGLDQLVLVFAARQPDPHLGLLDRLLVLAEAQSLVAVVCLNKVDLGPDPAVLDRLDFYRALGYAVVLTSVATGEGLDELRRHFAGHTSALLGPSGVGKSSLLNALEPGLGQRVSEISRVTGKGRHTTSGTRVTAIAGPDGMPGGYVADTAGIRAMAMTGVAAGRLDWCFREFRPYLGQCFHDDCRHRHEPGCAVREAVAGGSLDPRRYESYCRFYDEGAASRGRAWRDLISSRSLVGEGEFRM